jgi:hypothetical protein
MGAAEIVSVDQPNRTPQRRERTQSEISWTINDETFRAGGGQLSSYRERSLECRMGGRNPAPRETSAGEPFEYRVFSGQHVGPMAAFEKTVRNMGEADPRATPGSGGGQKRDRKPTLRSHDRRSRAQR